MEKLTKNVLAVLIPVATSLLALLVTFFGVYLLLSVLSVFGSQPAVFTVLLLFVLVLLPVLVLPLVRFVRAKERARREKQRRAGSSGS